MTPLHIPDWRGHICFKYPCLHPELHNNDQVCSLNRRQILAKIGFPVPRQPCALFWHGREHNMWRRNQPRVDAKSYSAYGVALICSWCNVHGCSVLPHLYYRHLPILGYKCCFLLSFHGRSLWPFFSAPAFSHISLPVCYWYHIWWYTWKQCTFSLISIHRSVLCQLNCMVIALCFYLLVTVHPAKHTFQRFHVRFS